MLGPFDSGLQPISMFAMATQFVPLDRSRQVDNELVCVCVFLCGWVVIALRFYFERHLNKTITLVPLNVPQLTDNNIPKFICEWQR